METSRSLDSNPGRLLLARLIESVMGASSGATPLLVKGLPGSEVRLSCMTGLEDGAAEARRENRRTGGRKVGERIVS